MGIGGRAVGRWRLIGDVPFEFESEVARASAVAEASHVESSTTSRHGCVYREALLGEKKKLKGTKQEGDD